MPDKIHTVFAQVRAPKESDGSDGVVVEGRYIVAGGVVTLTDLAGAPVRDQHGKFYKQKLRDGESAHVIAARLNEVAQADATWQGPGARRHKTRIEVSECGACLTMARPINERVIGIISEKKGYCRWRRNSVRFQN
jgi:hypothetical protein